MHNVERLFGGGWSRFVDEVIELGTAVTRFHQIARIVSRFLERGNSIKWKLVGPELWLDCPPYPISRCTHGLEGDGYNTVCYTGLRGKVTLTVPSIVLLTVPLAVLLMLTAPPMLPVLLMLIIQHTM